jgi:hypothetical protein
MAKLNEAEWQNLKTAFSRSIFDEWKTMFARFEKKVVDATENNLDDNEPDLVSLREWCRLVIGAQAAADRGDKDKGSQDNASTEKWISFATVLETTTDALVSAQKKLDEKSSDYAATSLFPSSYRIPKATMAFRFELTNVKETGFDLLFVNSGGTNTERNQQSLELDVVAVPPSPEFLAELALRRARIGLLRDPLLREQILKKASLGAGQLGDPKRVIVLGVPPHPSVSGKLAQDFYVMLAVGENPNFKYGISLVTEEADELRGPIVLRGYGPAVLAKNQQGKPDEEAPGSDVGLAKKLAEWCDQQAKDA